MTAVASVPAQASPDGVAPIVVLRPLRVDDRAAILAMFERCSVHTRLGRFHGPVQHFPSSHLDALLNGQQVICAVVAETPGVGVVALASAHRTAAPVAELAVLVEDAWQRRKLGTALLEHLLCACRSSGVDMVRGDVHTERRWVVERLRRRLPGMRVSSSRGAFHFEAPNDMA